ncbi:MAG TPA: hypothetical protein PKH09_03090 [Parvularculaceae bacterium]|nr:hypothetical protein [Parvularculaceae bacterium]
MMRLLLVIMAGALLSVSCASLDTVDKKPDRQTVARLLVDELTCKEVEGDDPCEEGEQPREIRFTELECVALPLRSERREDAHAECAIEGEIIRANGRRDPLQRMQRDFSLIDLTPGQYLPTRAWSIDKAQ